MALSPVSVSGAGLREGSLSMSERDVLRLSKPERDAIARELSRYARYRESVADDLHDAMVVPEPGEPDPPGITPTVERMLDSHFGVAQDCEDLAASFQSDEPTRLTPDALSLIEEVLDSAYVEALPPELERVATFARLARRQIVGIGDRNPAMADWFVAVNAETPPAATPGVAPEVAARDAEAMSGEPVSLGEQVAQLAARVDDLTAQIAVQRAQIDRLREQASPRRRGRIPFTTAFGTTGQSPRRSGPDLGM